jgi:type II secretory pathway pseudopilin PulG
MTSSRLDQQGFTIPELIVVMVTTVILTTIVIGFATYFWSSTATLQADSDTLVTRMNAGDALRNDLNEASGLITQNGIPDAHAMNPDPTAGSNYWLQIHAVPGSIPVGSGGTTTPLLYYEAPSIDSSKNFIMNGATPYQDEFVLYLDGTSKELLLRSLANPAASGDSTETSCPPSQATSTCPADRVIATDVSSVDTRYFSRSGNTIDWTSIIATDSSGNPIIPTQYVGPDYPAVEVVELTVHLSHASTIHGGTDTSNEVIVRVALRNG